MKFAGLGEKTSAFIRDIPSAIKEYTKEHAHIIAAYFLAVLSLSIVSFSEEIGGYTMHITLSIVGLSSVYFSAAFFKTKKISFVFIFLVFCSLIVLYFAAIYAVTGIEDSANGKQVTGDFFTALYFSVVTWTTLGYGDFRPSVDSRYWVLIEVVFGQIFTGLFISKLVLLYTNEKNKNV